ncbi:hypothetical protein MTO96_047688 [Rhipicephalus appendiculatus]
MELFRPRIPMIVGDPWNAGERCAEVKPPGLSWTDPGEQTFGLAEERRSIQRFDILKTTCNEDDEDDCSERVHWVRAQRRRRRANYGFVVPKSTSATITSQVAAAVARIWRITRPDSVAFCNEPSATGPDCVRLGALAGEATPIGFQATVVGRQEPRNDEGGNAVSLPSKDVGVSSNTTPGSAVSKRKLAKAEYENEYSERMKQLTAIGLLEDDPESAPEEDPGIPSKLPSRAAYMRAYRQRKKGTAETELRPQDGGANLASTSSCGRENAASSRKRRVETGQSPQKRRRESVRSPRGVEVVHQTRQRRQRQKRRGAGQRGDPQSGIHDVAHETTRRRRALNKDVSHEDIVDSSPPNASEPASSSGQDRTSSRRNPSRRDLK